MAHALITKTDSTEFTYSPNKETFAKTVAAKIGKIEAKGAAWQLLVAAQFVRENAKKNGETQETYAQAFGFNQGQMSKALTVMMKWDVCAPLRDKTQITDDMLVGTVIAIVNDNDVRGLASIAERFAKKKSGKEATLASLFQTVINTGIARGQSIEEIVAVFTSVVESNGEGTTEESE